MKATVQAANKGVAVDDAVVMLWNEVLDSNPCEVGKAANK